MITFDESAWPLVTITWSQEAASDADVEDMLARLAAFFEKKTRFAVIIDARAGSGVSAKQRRMFADFQTRYAQDLGAFCVMALVLATALQRGLVTAINWIAPPAATQQTFGDLERARAWCAERLRKGNAD